YNIFDMIMTAENEFAVVIKTDDNKFEMRLLTERDISEIKEKKIIKMAITLSSGSDIDDKTVKKFNSENDVYKIELVNYGNTGETPAEWAENLKKDIITGNSPDIVTFNSDMSIDTFGAKESIFVDFYSLLDNDNDFSRTDFIDGFLEGMESNGKLLMIDSGFTLKTLCIKNKFTNSFSQWNYEQFLEVYNNMPEDMILGGDIIVKDETISAKELRYVRKKDGLNISIDEVATGMKSFAYILRLLQNGYIDSETLLIIDEPEAHLHPQWVVKFAKILVLIHKYLGTKIMIASHNPDMVAAINTIASVEGLDDATNFYQAYKEPGSLKFSYKGFGNDVSTVFDCFNIALEHIDAYKPSSGF
ncbi:MAG: ATP-binding protein, partial [Muribaculaceae bacterium]|nr:ATP-binding protein [Muribaculaceae bacterium]